MSAHSTAGDVELTFTAPPSAVVAESTAGDVGVLVPIGPVYRVDAGTTAGSVEVGVADDPGARRDDLGTQHRGGRARRAQLTSGNACADGRGRFGTGEIVQLST